MWGLIWLEWLVELMMMRSARHNCVETISYIHFFSHNHREINLRDFVRVQDIVFHSKEFDFMSQTPAFNQTTVSMIILMK